MYNIYIIYVLGILLYVGCITFGYLQDICQSTLQMILRGLGYIVLAIID